MLKAAISHGGTVMLDVISPCVTFNDHEESTKSYKFMKDHEEPLTEADFAPAFAEIDVDYMAGESVNVTMHDGSHLRLRKLEEDYNPTDRVTSVRRLMQAKEANEVLTGIFYVNPEQPSFIDLLNLTSEALATLPTERVRPPRQVLEQIMEELR
jgi:2-oxoglutarate ferredoxin oxidoreductase subunit beta